MSYNDKYIDIKRNGILFPSFVLKNYKDFYLKSVNNEDVDICNKKQIKEDKIEFKKHQIFLTKIMSFDSPYKNILLYHGIGSGKTGSAIAVYNVLYNSSPNWNVFILVKASLKNTWVSELNKFLNKDEFENRFSNIKIISLDSPIADKTFMESIKNSNSSNKNLFIIDEAHNFFNNVYSNMNSNEGKRAQIIYDYLINQQTYDQDMRIIVLTATPIINKPFELGLLFNLLRPGIFPSETKFNEMFLTNDEKQILNPDRKYLFQKRIIGLVSVFESIDKNVYADQSMTSINIKMSEFQENIYNYFEKEEEKKNSNFKKSSKSDYKTTTRQACNFVFPNINQFVYAEARPRPSKLSFKDEEMIMEGKDEKVKNKIKAEKYKKEIFLFVDTFKTHLYKLNDDDIDNKWTIQDDIKEFKKIYEKIEIEINNNKSIEEDKKMSIIYEKSYEDFLKIKKKSLVFDILYKSSNKYIQCVFYITTSKGPIMVYSNYVICEGLQIFKIYLEICGFDNKSDYHNVVEFIGNTDPEIRKRNLNKFNQEENKYGKIYKIILISKAGTEGISLMSVRQAHILEPFWNKSIIIQVIGRAVRFCSHKFLPANERKVDVFQYVATKAINKNKITADELLYRISSNKEESNKSFLQALKEVSIDCELFRNINMTTHKYDCFKFDEKLLFETQIQSAYIDDINEDQKNSLIEHRQIEVKKISAVILLNEEGSKISKPLNYWFSNLTNIVYDYDLYYVIGKIMTDEDDIPIKDKENNYIINKLVPIPII